MYQLSVILPADINKNLLHTALQKLQKQSMRFNNIQIIIVDNPCITDCINIREDVSSNICHVKTNKFSKEAMYNVGLSFAVSDFILFSDCSYSYHEETLLSAYRFLTEHSETDLVSFPIFENGKTHLINYKYKEDLVVDLSKNKIFGNPYFYNTVFRKSALQDLRFQENETDAEGILFSFAVQLKKETEGIITSGAVIKPVSPPARPEEKLLIYNQLIEIASQNNKNIPLWIQHFILHDLRWYIKSKPNNLQKGGLKKEVENLLQQLDDSVICGLMNTSKIWQIFYLKLKHGDLLESELFYDEKTMKIKYHGFIIFDPVTYNRCDIVSLYKQDGKLFFEGLTDINALGDLLKLYCDNNHGVTAEAHLTSRPFWNIHAIDGTEVFTGSVYSISIPVHKFDEIKFYLRFKGQNTKIPVSLTFKERVGLIGGPSESFNSSYCVCGDHLLRYTSGNSISIFPSTLLSLHKFEKKYCNELIRIGRKDIVKMRKHVFKLKKKHKKTIWLITDRLYRGKDNGEAFFRYASSNQEIQRDHEIIYIIDGSNKKEFKRLSEYGSVMDTNSQDVKNICLISSAIITSSNSLQAFINPLGDDMKYFKNIQNYNYVYLKHGILLEDSSVRLHRMKAGFDLICTAANKEYDSVIHGNYGYTENQVILTGLARYDLLKNAVKEKLIVFLPTWRQYAAGTNDHTKNLDFKNTDYYHFYQSLINDSRLLTAMQSKGYRGEFYVHPAHRMNAADFIGNKIISVPGEDADYEKLFKTASLFITDYSSAIIDAAYLNKAIVYAQFDRSTFFDSHTYQKGYFNYEEDGFGPVCYDYENTILKIIDYIKSDCETEKKYIQRSNQFFTYHDQFNSKRIAEAILQKEEKH